MIIWYTGEITMATNPDSREYKSYNTDGKVVKTSTVGGKSGKQIKVTEVSLYAASGKDGINAPIMISINGTDYAGWIANKADYGDLRVYNKHPYTVDVGKDMVMSWTLTTANTKYPAKIKQLSYTFEYVDVEPVEDDTPDDTPVDDTTKGVIIIVDGFTESNVGAALKTIKTKLDESGISYSAIGTATNK